MKAIRVLQPGAPSVLQLTDVPDLKPEPGQVLIKVKAAGVNPVDTYLRAGEQGYKPVCPYTPGIDMAGEVIAVGDGVINVKPGDRVYSAGSITGSYAQYSLAKASHVFPLPENLSFSQGATVHVPYATAYRALMVKASARPGETVLVHGGTGGVGMAAIQICRWKGMTVFATAGSAHGANILKSIGTSAVVDHHDPEHFQTIITLTEGRGVDIIIEMLANVNLGKDLQLLRTGGRVVVVGSRGNAEINPRDIMSRDATITGLSLRNASDSELFAIHLDLLDGMKRGFISPIISHEVPLADAAHAHELIMNTRAEGKIVLIPEHQ